jgi:predicted house-cleaning noncanonical NTP pyrophosphatase (MazG superfamily)
MEEKLVRDKIPDIAGIDPSRLRLAADDKEYLNFVKAKLMEETEEFLSSESIDELADILEVVETLVEALGSDWHALQRIKAEKQQRRGAFGKRIILKLPT